MNSQTIGSVLRSLRDLKAILVRVERLASLQQTYAGAVPMELAKRSRVAYERGGTVVVVADTSAVAAKLRQLVPRIVIGIVKSAPEVTSIRVEVQVAETSDGPRDIRPEIGSRALSSLCELRDSLPDSPLRQAIGKLVSRREALDRQDQSLQRKEGEHD